MKIMIPSITATATIFLTSIILMTNAYAIHTNSPEMTVNTTISDSMNCQGTLDNPISMEQMAACETQRNIELLTGVMNYSQELQNRSGLPLPSPNEQLSTPSSGLYSDRSAANTFAPYIPPNEEENSEDSNEDGDEDNEDDEEKDN